MQQDTNTSQHEIEISPHRWRLAVIFGLFIFAVVPICSTVQESGFTVFALAHIALIIAYTLAGWFAVLPMWEKLSSKPALAVGVWLLPALVLAVVGLVMMRVLAEAPVMLYLLAPLFRLSQPNRKDLLPGTVIEWAVCLLVVAVPLAGLLIPWGEVISWIMIRVML